MTDEEKKIYMAKWRSEHKDQIKRTRRKWYEKHAEQEKAYTKNYVKNHPEWAKEREKKRRIKDRDKIYARNKVRNLVSKGKLEKKPCEKCGSDKNVQAHHDDYSKPLDITWLCGECHVKLHNKMNGRKEMPRK